MKVLLMILLALVLCFLAVWVADMLAEKILSWRGICKKCGSPNRWACTQTHYGDHPNEIVVEKFVMCNKCHHKTVSPTEHLQRNGPVLPPIW